MGSRFRSSIRRHGVGGAAVLGFAAGTIGGAKWLDRRLRDWPARNARIARTADELNLDGYLRDEAISSLRASSLYCYERRVTLWLQRRLLPETIKPSFYAAPIAAAAAAIKPGARVLAVGCRDDLELVLLAKALPGATILGLDLFSWHRRIVRGDMHAL